MNTTWFIRLNVLLALAALSLFGQANPPEPLFVTRVTGITSTPTVCTASSAQCIDNRSTRRQNDYHSFKVTGSGIWSVTMEYSNSASGPWTSFGTAAEIDQSSNPAIGFGNGYYAFIRFNITGNVSVSYSAAKGFYTAGSTGAASNPSWEGIGVGDGEVTTGLEAGSPLQYLRRKPNTSTPEYEFVSPGTLTTSDYNFPAQTYSTTITVPGNYTYSMSPCPLGVAGTNANHYLYLSGGVGTAEAVLINGGTCTSGAASGTIQVAVANAHSGSYTLTSATAGVQEAINIALASSQNRNVRIAGGTSTIRATITIAGANLTVTGDQSQSILMAANTVSPVIQVGTTGTMADHVWLKDFQVERTGTPPAGSVGVFWKWFSYCGDERITVRNHARGKILGSTTSLGFDSIDSRIDTASEFYLSLENAIEVTFHGGYLGVNAGGSTDSPTKAIIFKGISDTIKFNGTSIIPRGASTQWLGSFESFTSTNGVIYFDNVNSENIAGGFTSDSGTATINELSISNSRIALGTTAPLFSFNAATTITNLALTNNPSIFATISLTNPAWARITGNFITGTGGTFTGGSGAHMVFSMNTIASAQTWGGQWKNLVITGNNWHNSTPTITATSYFAGGLMVFGNSNNAGASIGNTVSTETTFLDSAITLAKIPYEILILLTPAEGKLVYCTNCRVDGSGACATGGPGLLSYGRAASWECVPPGP